MRADRSLRARLSRWFQPPRTLRPTRQGWWYLATVIAVGLVATNTGNNLLYLILSMMLAGIVVSGLLSEQCLRRIAVRRELAGPVFAGQPAFGRLSVRNRKRRLRSFSLRLSEGAPGGTPRSLAYLPHLGPGQEIQMGYQARFDRRGPARLPSIQAATAFPFGLFIKATRAQRGEEVLVLPRIDPLSVDVRAALGEVGVSARPARGLGAELHDVRAFRVGDDPRLIHWKQSAKMDRLMVRELESPEEAGHVTVVLEDPTRAPRSLDEIERLEEDVRFVASLAAHVTRAGGEVTLRHGGSRSAAYGGNAGLLDLLEYLARYVPPAEQKKAGPIVTSEAVSVEDRTVIVWLGRGLARILGPRGEGGRLMRIGPSTQEIAR
ncbi:MAG: DUF58 domain-containing protein [Candidatus Methylomirabilaceae bacterium]